MESNRNNSFGNKEDRIRCIAMNIKIVMFNPAINILSIYLYIIFYSVLLNKIVYLVVYILYLIECMYR